MEETPTLLPSLRRGPWFCKSWMLCVYPMDVSTDAMMVVLDSLLAIPFVTFSTTSSKKNKHLTRLLQTLDWFQLLHSIRERPAHSVISHRHDCHDCIISWGFTIWFSAMKTLVCHSDRLSSLSRFQCLKVKKYPRGEKNKIISPFPKVEFVIVFWRVDLWAQTPKQKHPKKWEKTGGSNLTTNDTTGSCR